MLAHRKHGENVVVGIIIENLDCHLALALVSPAKFLRGGIARTANGKRKYESGKANYGRWFFDAKRPHNRPLFGKFGCNAVSSAAILAGPRIHEQTTVTKRIFALPGARCFGMRPPPTAFHKLPYEAANINLRTAWLGIQVNAAAGLPPSCSPRLAFGFEALSPRPSEFRS
jgi:hypothetical protein